MPLDQLGILHKVSCLQSLVNFLDEVPCMLERRGRIEVCCLEFQKAVDSGNHRPQDQKAEDFGGYRKRLDSTVSEGYTSRGNGREMSDVHTTGVHRGASGVCLRTTAFSDASH